MKACSFAPKMYFMDFESDMMRPRVTAAFVDWAGN